jgi:hypothetical protein
MSVSSGLTNPDHAPSRDSDLTPLVSDEAKEFLEGKMPASVYVDLVRRDAVNKAGRDAHLRREYMRKDGVYVRASYVKRSGPTRISGPLESRFNRLVRAISLISAGVVGAALSVNSHRVGSWLLFASVGGVVAVTGIVITVAIGIYRPRE